MINLSIPAFDATRETKRAFLCKIHNSLEARHFNINGHSTDSPRNPSCSETITILTFMPRKPRGTLILWKPVEKCDWSMEP